MGEVQSALKPVEEEFEKDWKEGNVEGWQKKANGTDGKANQESGDGIWCAACKYDRCYCITGAALNPELTCII